MMTETTKWRADGVRVVRGQALATAMRRPSGTGRATAFDFAGTGGKETWIGAVTLPPGAKTGAHHHGRHEVGVYVVKGRSEIRWGERLEFAAEVGPGDFVYFAPYVPHQELNSTPARPLNSSWSAATTRGSWSSSMSCPSSDRRWFSEKARPGMSRRPGPTIPLCVLYWRDLEGCRDASTLLGIRSAAGIGESVLDLML